MSNPYRLTPGRLPAAPHPTPTSVSGYTLPNSKIGRTPIANPYDKFTQPEFDAWIGDITGTLKRALGHDEGPPQAKQSLSEGGDIPRFRPIDLPEDSDNDGVDDSFAEVKARRAAGKGKARDPREGPGFGKLPVAQPIEIPSSDEEEEEEVEYSILHQNDSDAEEEAQDGEGEIEEDEEYPWSTAEGSHGVRAAPTRVRRDAVDSDNDEYDEDDEVEHEAYDEEAESEEYDEEAEYEEYDEEAESEGQLQGQVRPEDDVIELLSDDEEPPVAPNRSRSTAVEEEPHDEEEYYDEEDEVKDADEDQGGARSRRRDEGIVEDGDDEFEEVQPLQDDHSFPPQAIDPLATTSTRRSMSVEVPNPWHGPRLYAQDHYTSSELQTSSERKDPSYLGAEGDVNDGTTLQVPIEDDQAMGELQYLDASPAALTSHDLPQHAGDPVLVNQAEADGYLHASGMPLDHIRTSPSPFQELSFDRELVEHVEEHFIQPSDENTSFPVQTEERDNHLVQIPDPWHGPREYAQDFYAGGNIRLTPWVHLNADHMVPEDEDDTDESQARKEQEAEDDLIQPQEQDTALLHDGVRAGAVEIPDPWQGPETYAQDYYSSGINGALPTDRIDPALLSGTGETEDEYSSFLTPYTRTPSQPVDTEAEEKQEDEGDGSGRFALPPAPEGIYTPPSWRARDAPIPADAEIFNVDDSDDEENGNPVPITEYPGDEDIIEARGEAVTDELEYVDEDGMYVTEVVSAPEVASRDRDVQPELVLEQNLSQEDLAIPEESEEVLSSLVDWNNPPAFLNGAPTSASRHLATPPSEGGISVTAERSTAINNQATAIEEVLTQGDLISAGKGQSPPLPDDAATSVMSQHEAVSMPETTELPAIAFGDTSETYIDVTEKLSEEVRVVQEPDELSAHSSVTNGNAAVGVNGPEGSAMEDVSGDVPEIDQSTTINMSEPLPPIDSQDEESKVPELDLIVEEAMHVTQSRAGTAPLPDPTLEELDHRAFLTDEKDTHPVIGIVEHEETPASPRETTDRENLIVEITEEHTEHAFISQHSGLAHPMFTILHPAHSDDLSYEDYASSVEVDELDEEETRRPNEDVAPSVPEVPVEQNDVDSSRVPETVIFTTNTQIGSDVPFDPPLVEEVSEGKLPHLAPSDTNDATPLQDHTPPPSSNSAGEQWRVIAPAGNEHTLHHSAEANLTKPDERSNMITDNSEANIPAPKASQTTDLSLQDLPEVQTFAVDLASIVSSKGMEAGDDEHVDDSVARSQTPVQQISHPSIATPGNVSTARYPEAVFRTPERYTPSPPKGGAIEAPQVSSPIPDAAARDRSSHVNDVGDVIRTQEDSKDVAQAISSRHNSQPQSTSPMNGPSSRSHQLLSPPYKLSELPPPDPRILLDNQLEYSRNQSTANIDSSISTTTGNAESRFQRPSNEPNIQLSSFTQTSILRAPITIEQFHPQILPTLSGTWPYSLSTPGTQQFSTYVDPPIGPSPKGRKKPRATGASPKSPKKGKKTAQHKKPQADDLSLKLHYPFETDRKPTLSDTMSEVKGTMIQDELLKSKTVTQSESDRRSENVPGLSGNFYGQDNLIRDESLPAITGLEPSSTISKVEGVGQPEKGPQKPKRTYKRKRDASPGPGEPQVGKADEKKTKRPTKRKSKLLELEGPIPGPSNGETIHVKAKPKGASPVELSQTNFPITSKETVTKSKRGLLSAQSASLPGSSVPQTPKPAVFLITRAGISHRHGSDHSLTIPPAAPSFKVLSPRTTSPRKPSLPQTLRQTQPFSVAQSGASLTPESSNLTSLPPTSTMPDVMPPTNVIQPNEATETVPPAVGAPPGVPQSSSVDIQTLPAPTTQAPTQHPEVVAASSDPQTLSNVTHMSAKSGTPSNSPSVAPITAPAPDTPSAPVARPIIASVGNTPTSQAGTPTTTMRETRSSCRYHRISLPKEEGGPRVRFLVPGCAMTNHILMKEQEIVDHGLAPVEDAYVMIKDIESLDLDSDLISVLRVLVGHDIFRDQELFYLPSPGEQLQVRPAFRKPTLSDKLESSRHNAGSPSHSSLIGSPTFHKSTASVSGSTSSLSALRQAQTPEWSSNLAPTDSEGDSDNEDAHSKASQQASEHKGKGKSRAKSARKSKLGHDPDFVPTKEDENKLSDAGDSTRKRRKPTGSKRGVKRTRTEAPAGDDPSRHNKRLKAHSTAPPSIASPEKPALPDAPTNDS